MAARTAAPVKPRLADVATLAGVSMKTVSNVVNDQPHVTPAMRERVLAAIQELDYSPNISARNLARAPWPYGPEEARAFAARPRWERRSRQRTRRG